MSMSETDPAEPVTEPGPGPSSAPGRWKLVSLIDHDSQEPPTNLPERAALATWCAISAPWHPSLLAESGALPRIESVDGPSAPGPNEVFILAEGSADRLPSGFRTQVEDSGAILIE